VSQQVWHGKVFCPRIFHVQVPFVLRTDFLNYQRSKKNQKKNQTNKTHGMEISIRYIATNTGLFVLLEPHEHFFSYLASVTS
jgi:hypothetical protein